MGHSRRSALLPAGGGRNSIATTPFPPTGSAVLSVHGVSRLPFYPKVVVWAFCPHLSDEEGEVDKAPP